MVSFLFFLGVVLWLDLLLNFFSGGLTLGRWLNWCYWLIYYLSFFREVE